jgi:NADH:ubiquinone oxidoreductase subunit 6 (subunit J)
MIIILLVMLGKIIFSKSLELLEPAANPASHQLANVGKALFESYFLIV